MPTPNTSREVGSVLGGRYRLVAPVGVGASSKVFLAVDNQLRRRVAVKLLHEALSSDAAFLARFREEARRAAALSHPSILAVYDWGEDELDGTPVPFLVTEYLAGGSLRSMLDAGERLSPSQALSVGLQACRALAHAHQRSLVHRDVKPANLLFDDVGRLRLADFGVAKALAEASYTAPSAAGVGAVRYASPEQVLGLRVDGRSDVYSLALVLIEAVQGTVPLLGDTPAGTMGLRSNHDVEVSVAFGPMRGALLEAVIRDREQRCDAGSFEIGLRAAAEDLPRPAPLPLVPTVSDDRTVELHLSDPMAGLAILGRPDAGGANGSGAHGAGDVGDGGGPEEPVVAADDAAVWADGAADAVPQGAPQPTAIATISSNPVGKVAPLRHSDVHRPLDERPRRARLRRRLGLVAAVLLIGGGVLWWTVIRTPTHEVPGWVGESVERVRAQADDLGWTLDDETLVRIDGTEAGEVVEQDPAGGATLAEGEVVRVTVSLGPTLVAMPGVVGTPEAEAMALLEDSGLVLGVRHTQFDETTPAGAVVEAVPSVGEPAVDDAGQIPRETAIDVVISDGPAPRTVPDGLVGLARADAEARLAAVQLTAAVTGEHSDTVAEGTVITSPLAAGTPVPRDSPVPLVVSLGPPPVPIPNVAGSSGAAAAATLEGAGFVVSGIEGSPSGTVLATDPPAGEAHRRGTAVRIFTRR